MTDRVSSIRLDLRFVCRSRARPESFILGLVTRAGGIGGACVRARAHGSGAAPSSTWGPPSEKRPRQIVPADPGKGAASPMIAQKIPSAAALLIEAIQREPTSSSGRPPLDLLRPAIFWRSRVGPSGDRLRVGPFGCCGGKGSVVMRRSFSWWLRGRLRD